MASRRCDRCSGAAGLVWGIGASPFCCRACLVVDLVGESSSRQSGRGRAALHSWSAGRATAGGSPSQPARRTQPKHAPAELSTTACACRGAIHGDMTLEMLITSCAIAASINYCTIDASSPRSRPGAERWWPTAHLSTAAMISCGRAQKCCHARWRVVGEAAGQSGRR